MNSHEGPEAQPELPDVTSSGHVYPALEQSAPASSGRGLKLALAGAAVAAVAAVAVVAVTATSGSREAAPATESPTATSGAGSGDGTGAEGVLVPTAVSTTCLNGSDAVAPFSGDASRAWVCQRTHGLDQNVLNVTFREPVTITSIAIVPGFDHVTAGGRDEWAQHRQVTDVTWRMGGKVFPQRVEPSRAPATAEFPSVTTQSLSLTINASARSEGGPASADETTAVSKIVITGRTATEGTPSPGK
ncbi:hypothetical protein [Mycolicibacterium conceptionense]|uniref:hypothetical protein n=1 Tax=Mycolicibacterium conceptionense TaxID=451644 RepID=UPI0006627F17|nr:hypothetical protein [Mycolicibacterium conceptionense]